MLRRQVQLTLGVVGTDSDGSLNLRMEVAFSQVVEIGVVNLNVPLTWVYPAELLVGMSELNQRTKDSLIVLYKLGTSHQLPTVLHIREEPKDIPRANLTKELLRVVLGVDAPDVMLRRGPEVIAIGNSKNPVLGTFGLGGHRLAVRDRHLARLIGWSDWTIDSERISQIQFLAYLAYTQYIISNWKKQ